VDIYNTYYKTVIFYNFEVLFFEQNEHFKELGCFKFCSYCINKYYNTICSINTFLPVYLHFTKLALYSEKKLLYYSCYTYLLLHMALSWQRTGTL